MPSGRRCIVKLRFPGCRYVNLPSAEVALILVTAVFNELLFFRHSVFGGFDRISADLWDGRLMMANLEHWHRVWMGDANWQNPIFFYPIRGVLGYNDGLLFYGAIYSLFRTAGADWFAAYELVNMTIKLIGFLAFFALVRHLLRVRLHYALLGSSIFFQLNSTAAHLGHSQLLSVAFVPLMLILLYSLVMATTLGEKGKIWFFALAGIVTYEIWLMSSFYMAWFFFLFLTISAVLFAMRAGPASLRRYAGSLKASAGTLLGIAFIAALASIPFVQTYMPTARETGMHDISTMRGFSGSPLDVLNVGEGNLLYGKAFDHLRVLLSGRAAVGEERSTGFTPLLLLLFGLGLVYCWKKPIGIDQRIVRAVLLAVVLLWMASFRWGPFLPWDYLFDYFPGAKAIRVPPRFQIFVGFFVVAAATVYLDRARLFDRPALFAVLALVLLAEQYNTGYGWGITREKENWIFVDIPAPRADCKSFFILRPEQRPDLSPGIRDYYLHNLDAMILAERFNLPTLNGAESQHPRDWDLFRPLESDYLDRVLSYARAMGVRHGLCSLDIPTRRWALVVSMP